MTAIGPIGAATASPIDAPENNACCGPMAAAPFCLPHKQILLAKLP